MFAGGQVERLARCAPGGGGEGGGGFGELQLRVRLVLGHGRYQHPTGRRGVLQPPGDGDGLADGGQPGAAGGAGEVDRAAVDADAHSRAGPVGRPGRAPASGGLAYALIEQGQFRLQRQRGAQGAGRVARARLGQAKEGQQAIAGVLVDLPAVGQDDGVEHLPHGVEGVAHLLGVHALRQRREAGQVRHQHGQLPLLLVARIRL